MVPCLKKTLQDNSVGLQVSQKPSGVWIEEVRDEKEIAKGSHSVLHCPFLKARFPLPTFFRSIFALISFYRGRVATHLIASPFVVRTLESITYAVSFGQEIDDKTPPGESLKFVCKILDLFREYLKKTNYSPTSLPQKRHPFKDFRVPSVRQYVSQSHIHLICICSPTSHEYITQ